MVPEPTGEKNIGVCAAISHAMMIPLPWIRFGTIFLSVIQPQVILFYIAICLVIRTTRENRHPFPGFGTLERFFGITSKQMKLLWKQNSSFSHGTNIRWPEYSDQDTSGAIIGDEHINWKYKNRYMHFSTGWSNWVRWSVPGNMGKSLADIPRFDINREFRRGCSPLPRISQKIGWGSCITRINMTRIWWTTGYSW